MENLGKIMSQPPTANTAGRKNDDRNHKEWKPPRWGNVAELDDGDQLATCKQCPKKTHDRRDPTNPAKHSGIASKDSGIFPAWFREHEKTEMHKWYSVTHPPRDPSKEELLLAEIFGKKPAPQKQHFAHAARGRLAKY